MENAARLILDSSLGTELTDEEATTLASLMQMRSLGDGEYLTTEGATDDSLHVLLEGKLEVVKQAGAGETATLGILRDGELAGELSFIDGAPHTVGLRALCDSRVFSLKRDVFEGLVEDHPGIVYKVMRAIVRSAHKTLSRMNYEFIELSNYIFKQHGRY
ncbi:Crp/Fnr family transcriptional regulator [Lentisalinibacter orientalis]|uniref:Crp/Fnr family transcriptional regulator n=1 Tax=Lentisalinibacter orientalis TaxID=2992241 RepID=UPI0038672711